MAFFLQDLLHISNPAWFGLSRRAAAGGFCPGSSEDLMSDVAWSCIPPDSQLRGGRPRPGQACSSLQFDLFLMCFDNAQCKPPVAHVLRTRALGAISLPVEIGKRERGGA